MKLLYINDELATGDGSNSHAVGMLRSFEKILGKENVCCYPDAEDGSQKPTNLKSGNIRANFKNSLQVIRFFRKKLLSEIRGKAIVKKLKRQKFIPTHVIARSTVFDTTAIYVAKAFHAKLVYEINTPMFYECGIIKKEPLIGAIEKWEKKILESSDYVYIVSSVCRDMLCKQYGLSKDKFFVIPNGYMGELYTESNLEKEAIRDEFRTKENLDGKFVVTFVGSLKVWHGIKTFCETAALLEKDNSIRFLVLGDGDMHDMIADYTEKHSNMIFKGKVNLDMMKNLLYSSDLGIMPYEKKENFYYSPLKMFDMIGAGLPYIGTPIGQIKEFCLENLNEDFLCEASSNEGFRSSIVKLKNNGECYKSMKQCVSVNRSLNTWQSRAEDLLRAIM